MSFLEVIKAFLVADELHHSPQMVNDGTNHNESSKDFGNFAQDLTLAVVASSFSMSTTVVLGGILHEIVLESIEALILAVDVTINLSEFEIWFNVQFLLSRVSEVFFAIFSMVSVVFSFILSVESEVSSISLWISIHELLEFLSFHWHLKLWHFDLVVILVDSMDRFAHVMTINRNDNTNDEHEANKEERLLVHSLLELGLLPPGGPLAHLAEGDELHEEEETEGRHGLDTVIDIKLISSHKWRWLWSIFHFTMTSMFGWWAIGNHHGVMSGGEVVVNRHNASQNTDGNQASGSASDLTVVPRKAFLGSLDLLGNVI